jgi:hypothetical protein
MPSSKSLIAAFSPLQEKCQRAELTLAKLGIARQRSMDLYQELFRAYWERQLMTLEQLWGLFISGSRV